MLYVFFGTDIDGARRAGIRMIESLREQDPELRHTRVDGEDYEPGLLLSLADSVSLFNGAETYLIDTPSATPDFFVELLQEATALQESKHHFVVIDTKFTAADKKVLSKAATSVEEYKSDEASGFNMFSLADALSRKDKKALWMLLEEAKREGAKAEEVIGILWWQLKLLRLATKTKSAADAGVKDFPYNKAKRALPAFQSGEIDRLSRSLLLLYHDGHSGKRDISLALEEWVLTM
jgi:DNA polymerase III delta subunit